MSISGKKISLKIGDVTPVVQPGAQGLTADVDAEELDGTVAEDEGFDNPDDGCKKCTITGQLVMDITTGSFIAIRVGTLITDLKFYADIEADDPIYHLLKAKVFRSTYKGEIKGRVTYDVTIKSKGPFIENEPN